MRPLSESIWQARLQVSWILLSAAYVAIGKVYPRREVSSLLILVAGVLLVGLLCHVLIQTDIKKTRGVLLVAFGGSVFLITNSISPFNDILAAGFASLFVLMTGTLLVLRLGAKSSQRLRYRYFVSIVFTLVGSIIGLLFTLLVKYVLTASGSREGYYVIGMQGVAAVACFSTGFIAGPSVLPSTFPYNSPRERRKSLLLVLALLPAAVLMALYHQRLLNFFGDLPRALSFIVCQSVLSVLVSLALVQELVRARGWGFKNHRALRFAVVAVLFSAVTTAVIVELLKPGGNTNWAIRAAGIEAPTYFSIYGGILLGTVLARAGARSARGRRRRRKVAQNPPTAAGRHPMLRFRRRR